MASVLDPLAYGWW